MTDKDGEIIKAASKDRHNSFKREILIHTFYNMKESGNFMVNGISQTHKEKYCMIVIILTI